MSKEPRVFDPALTALSVVGAMVGLVALAAVIVRGPATIAAEGGTPSATEEAAVASIRLAEWTIDGDLSLKPGATTFEIVNDGTVAHNFSILGVGTSEDISSGADGTFEVSDLPAGSYEVICAIAGHKEAGMRTVLTVAENATGAGTASHGAHSGEDLDWAALDAAMAESIAAFPAETRGKGNQVLEPTDVLADGTKVFDLTAEIVEWEVEPGRFVEAWTYNGMVPGPTLKLEVGDEIQVRLQNDLPMGTDIHWHGVDTPNNQDGVAPLTQPLIGPGELYTYEFTATHQAVGMYHAHHHGQMQVPNGMFAAMIVGDVTLPLGETISGVTIPEDLELAEEITMVLNDAGTIGFSLNGKSFPATEPYVLQQGDWYLVHYYNEGLQIHPMHQHQFNGLVVAKDGIPLDYPYWVDTLNVAPGERYTVLHQATDPGAWVWHCHILNHVEREEGMFGMVTAVIVEPSA